MASKSLTLKAMRARAEAQVAPRLGVRVIVVFVVLQLLLLATASLVFACPARAEPMKGDITVSTEGGFARDRKSTRLNSSH